MDNRTCGVVLLRSFKRNFPIMKSCGLELKKLPMVIVDEGQMRSAIRLLSDTETKIIRESMKIPEIKEYIEESNSTFLMYPYTHTKKGVDFIRFLSSIIQVGEFSDMKMNAMPIVISEGIPQGYDLEDVFLISLDGELDDIWVKDMLEVPPDNSLTMVNDKINHIVTEKHSAEEKSCLTAVCFTYPNLVTDGMEDEFDEMVKYALKLVELDEASHDTNGLTDAFIRTLRDHHRRRGATYVYELPTLSCIEEARIDRAIFYDDNYVYISCVFFKTICQPILQTVSMNVLKAVLAENDILCKRGEKTFTSKMSYQDQWGTYNKKTMLRFHRKKLNIAGELDFISACKMDRR